MIILFRYLGNNFGDNLSTFIVHKVSGEHVRNVDYLPRGEVVYVVIGSILHNLPADSIVWGAGYMGANSRMRKQPLKICAVRGKLTRDQVIKQGFSCPEVYGDPALLCPKYYDPVITNKFKLGIIPHYVDQDSVLLDRFKKDPCVLFINVRDPINKIMDEINSCERILSSSLHGLIVADAYGIPSLWIELSDKVTGGGFKFRDYFSSVGRKNDKPLLLDNSMDMDFILNSFEDYRIQIDLDKLLEVCPFRNGSKIPIEFKYHNKFIIRKIFRNFLFRYLEKFYFKILGKIKSTLLKNKQFS